MWNPTLSIKITKIDFATLGPSWNFSLTENLASLSLQDGLRSGIIISQIQPPSQLSKTSLYQRNSAEILVAKFIVLKNL